MIPTETMPSLRADIAELLEVFACARGYDPLERLYRGAQTLRWCDERERRFDQIEYEDLTEEIEGLKIEHDAERDEWDAERRRLEDTIARLREDLAEALAA